MTISTPSFTHTLALLAAGLGSFGGLTLATTADGTAEAASSCDRWLSSNGSDNFDGTSPQGAFATMGTLAAVLQPGETGCIPAGETFVAHGAGVVGAVDATADAPITITSGPGGRATIRGGLLFNHRSHDIVVTDLDVIGDGFTGNAIQVEGTSIELSNLDVRHPLGICVGVGSINGYQHDYVGNQAYDITISNSRVHDCGTDPSLAPKWELDSFSGSHGIYVVNARGTEIVDNAIYDNQYRGVQVFPAGKETLVARNVLDNNATHVNVGSTLADGFPWRSSGTVVRDNVMSNRVTGFRPGKNPAQVHGYFPVGTHPDGNLVTANCMVDETGPEVSGNGIEVGSNTMGFARYADRAAGDFRQTDESPCRRFGPEWSMSTPALRAEPSVDCSGPTAKVFLPTDVRTPNGSPTWAYSRIWHRVDGGTWQRNTWFAANANTGAQQSWWYRAPGSTWAQIGDATDLGVTNGTVDAWEQRYEFVDGAWHYEWHAAGRCEVN